MSETYKKGPGFLLILNVSTEPAAAENDVARLRKFFGNTLKFDVKEEKGRKLGEINKFLNDAIEKLQVEKDKHCCFICVVIGQGEEGGIKVSDSVDPLSFETIRKRFSNSTTNPFFTGRPKIFFFPTDQGTKYQKSLPSDSEKVVPVDADVLMAFANTPGFRAYHDEKNQSDLIQKCIDVFEKHYGNRHLEEMMIIVREQVSALSRSNAQMPCTWSTLTRRLYFIDPVKIDYNE